MSYLNDIISLTFPMNSFNFFVLFRYVICTLHCDVPTIVHMCGFDTANLVIDLTRKSFASMETMALDTGAVSRSLLLFAAQ